MKKDTLIFALAILILAAAGLMYNYQPLKIDQDTSVVVEENPNKACYLSYISTPLGDDNTYLEATLSSGGIVTGRFNLLPAAKDKLTGPFVGNWSEATSSLVLTVNHTYTAEGVTTQEPRVFRLTSTGAEISWDQGKTFTQTLPQVSCVDVSDGIVKGR
jgi:hypothetical protein